MKCGNKTHQKVKPLYLEIPWTKVIVNPRLKRCIYFHIDLIKMRTELNFSDNPYQDIHSLIPPLCQHILLERIWKFSFFKGKPANDLKSVWTVPEIRKFGSEAALFWKSHRILN